MRQLSFDGKRSNANMPKEQKAAVSPAKVRERISTASHLGSHLAKQAMDGSYQNQGMVFMHQIVSQSSQSRGEASVQ